MFAATNDPNGAYLLLFLGATVVALWPLYRWAFRGLGYFFVLFGAVGLGVALIAGGAVVGPATLLGGGLLLRLVVRRKRAQQRQPRPRPARATSAPAAAAPRT